MKMFFGLMAVLLLSLSFFPCGDKQDCAKDVSALVTEVNHDADGHNHTTEFCAPFCSCACCSIIFYSEISVKNFTANCDFSIDKFAEYNNEFHLNVFFSIWHPPQLA